MKTFITLWFDTPRWVRGLFLGNLGYIMLVPFCFSLAQNRSLPNILDLFLIPVLTPVLVINFSLLGSRFVLLHIAWCAFGALLIQLFGEKKGMILLIFLMFIIGMAFFAYRTYNVWID